MRIAGFDSAWMCSLGSDEPGRSAVSVRKRQQPASCFHPIKFGFGHIGATYWLACDRQQSALSRHRLPQPLRGGHVAEMADQVAPNPALNSGSNLHAARQILAS